MVQEAEQFKAEDEAQREKVTAKNSLESLAFNMKSTVEDEKLQDKISPEDKKTIVDKCNEVIAWLDKNQVTETRFLISFSLAHIVKAERQPQSCKQCIKQFPHFPFTSICYAADNYNMHQLKT